MKMERAAWVPGWYELDQPLEVGLEAEFVFWRVVPDSFRRPERFVFYNDTWRPEKGVFAQGKIAAIHHPELGQIRKVDTCGLDYKITLLDGTLLAVNAEEEPGKIYERQSEAWIQSPRVLSDWTLEVEFESISET